MLLINGQPSAVISVFDRGFQYGDGLFETLAVDKGVPLCLPEHLDRLCCGCRRLGIPEPGSGPLREEIETVAGEPDCGVLKIIVTRGSGGRGYAPRSAGPPTRAVAGFERPDYPREYYEQGIKTRLCGTRLARHPDLAGIKHMNRLEQVLGGAECAENGVPEGIMRDTRGNLVEGTMSNLFLVRGNALITPVLTQSGILGIVRGRILALARASGRVRILESVLTPSDLRDVDEVFFCNSLIGIWPVRRFEDVTYAVGPVTRWLQAALASAGVIAK